MKPFTLLAFVAAWVVVFTAQILDGGKPASLFSHPGPLLLVFGGSILAAAMGSNFADLKQTGVALKIAMLGRKLPTGAETLDRMKELADVARRDGLLALESKVATFDSDPFLRRGAEMILDGVDPEELRELLETDIAALEERHKVPQKFLESAGGFAPTIGIVGTVMGLVHVLESLDQPDKLGPAIGAAFLATLWGVASANLLYLPLAFKLKRLTAEEVAHRELVIEGLVAVHIGKNPRQVAERLKAHLSVKARGKLKDA